MNDGRTNRRTARLMRGSVTIPDRGSHDVLIQNISRHGIGIKFSGPALQIGETVRIDIPALGVFNGTVQWHIKDRAGILLTGEIDPSAARFDSSELATKESETYRVPDRFQPATSIYRPGFGRK